MAVLISTLNARTFNLAVVLGTMSLMFLVMSFLIGPQLLRQDFRQDLPMADVLKAYPLRGWQVALGELLAPAAILTGVQWLLIVLSAGLSANLGERPLPLDLRLAIAGGLAMVAPVLNAVTLMIPNAAVLLFPGWFQTGQGRAAGNRGDGPAADFCAGPAGGVRRWRWFRRRWCSRWFFLWRNCSWDCRCQFFWRRCRGRW